jgi:hypothetical protein
MPVIVKGIVTPEEHYAKHERLKGKGFEAPDHMRVSIVKVVKPKKRKTV